MMINRDTIYKFDNNVYSDDRKNQFKYNEKEREILYDISNIISHAKGIYVLAGNRGVGKSSILEKSIQSREKEKYKDTPIVLRVDALYAKDNFYKEFLLQLKEHKLLEEFHNKIDNVIDALVYNTTEITNQEEKEDYSVSRGWNWKLSAIFKNTGVGLEKDSRHINSNSTLSAVRKELTLSEHEKREKFISLLREIDKSFDMILTIDEMDKLNIDEVRLFVEKFKVFFSCANLLTFFVCDKNNALYLKKNFNPYINDIIFYNSLDIYDFVSKIQTMELQNSINECIILYYITLGNHKKIIHAYYSHFKSGRDIHDKSRLLLLIIMTEAFYEVKDEYKDILLGCIKEFIELLFLIGSVDNNALNNLIFSYTERNCSLSTDVHLLISGFFESIKEEMTLSYIMTYTRHKKSRSNENDMNVVRERLMNYELYIFNSCQQSFIKNEIKDNISSMEETLNDEKNYDVFDRYLDYILKNNVEKLRFFPSNYNIDEILISEKSSVHEHDSIEKCIEKINYHYDEVLGVIIFYPFTDSDGSAHNRLRNGYIVTYNGETIELIGFLGSPGLESHKPSKIEDLYKFTRANGIKTIAIENNEYSKEIWYDSSSSTDGSTINTAVKKEVLEDLLRIFSEYYNYDTTTTNYYNVKAIS